LKKMKVSLHLTAPSNRIRWMTTPNLMTVLPVGAVPVMNCSPAMWPNDTFLTNFTNTKPNWPTTDDGRMNLPMVMYGFLLKDIPPGDPTPMDAGFGTPSSVGPGFLHIPGAGVPPGMDGGTGDPLGDGTGFLRGDGDLPGYTGITGMTILDGVHSAIGTGLWSSSTTVFTAVITIDITLLIPRL